MSKGFKKLNALIIIAAIMMSLVGFNISFNVVNNNLEIPEVLAAKSNFSATESPSFIIDLGLKIENNQVVEDEIKIIKSEVIDSRNRITNIQPIVEKKDGNLAVSFPKDSISRPGQYKIQITYEKNGEILTYNKNFNWGVLALNTDKTFYLPNENAFISMAVLDKFGGMVCDADTVLEITDPNGQKTILSTTNGKIIISPDCKFYGITNLSDYYTDYQVGEIGIYNLKLTATTANGIESIEDEIKVVKSVDFDVQRTGPTRIFPVLPQPMEFSITASKNYSGPVIEYVPNTFEIAPQDGLTITKTNYVSELKWEVDMVKGQTYKFSYEFDAPDVSPDFYLLGPIKIKDFQESRQWQIAVDATTFITDTGQAQYTPLSDWNDTNTIEVIGGGGGGASGNNGAGGGAGGTYAVVSNVDLTSGVPVNIQVGIGGSAETAGEATWFNGANCAAASACGSGGTTVSNGTGATAAAGDSGPSYVLGGNGGNGTASGDTGGGGGGAGGPDGGGTPVAGRDGGLGDDDTASGGGGGGGGAGGASSSAGEAAPETTGGLGGNGRSGTGGGARGDGGPGGNGTAGTGGGGGGGDDGEDGGIGGDGNDWDASHGAGGGGGGSGDAGNGDNGGAGGLYGGGGGGGRAGGKGGDGIIVITYDPVVTVTIGDNLTSEPSPATTGPGDGIIDLDHFTLIVSAGSDTMTAAVVTLSPAGAFNNIALVDITNMSDTAQCTAVAPSGNTVTFGAATCTLGITTSEVEYKIRITPKSHAAMDAVPGASYATEGLLTGITVTAAVTAGSDDTNGTITVDNLSPTNATSLGGAAGDQQVTLNWTTSVSTDYNSSVIFRWTGASAGAEVPDEGGTYSVDQVVTTATVACVETTGTENFAESGVDGAGTGGCSAVALSNGQEYSYKVFQKDDEGNYDAGNEWGVTYTPSVGNSTPVVNSAVDYSDPLYESEDVVFEVNWTDSNNEGIKLYVCTDGNVSVGGCDTSTWCSNSAAFSFENAISCSYTTGPGDVGSAQNYWAFVCDDEECAAAAGTGSFTVLNTAATSTILMGGFTILGGFTIK